MRRQKTASIDRVRPLRAGLVTLMLAILMTLPLHAQPATRTAVHPVVKFDGAIERIHLAPGEGMPFLEVKKDSRVTRVYLGPMRYLMEQNFSPKAGQSIEGKGYRREDAIVGIEVKLPASGQTLRLRDESGRPLWRGGHRRSEGRRSAR